MALACENPVYLRLPSPGSDERYQDLFDNTNDLIQIVSAEGRILCVNRAWRETLGYPDEGLAPLNLLQILHPDRRTEGEEVLRRALAGETVRLAELELISKDGRKVVVEASVTRPPAPDGASALRCIMRDITEKKRLQVQLLRNQRLESIGTLAGGMAHDLNNALAPIMMSIQLLRMKLTDPESGGILDTIETSARRGAAMVKQVLTFSRGVEGKTTNLQMRHLIKEMEVMIVQTFPKSIRVRAEIGKNLWVVRGDATQLHQVVLNLCVNARDAMPHGGKLWVRAENVLIDEHFARMKPEAGPGPYVVLTVADTGMGFSAEVRERIFEPFYTTKPLGQGTGLGLSTVRAIVQGHGGFLSVHSEVGRGSEFKVYLPAQVEPARTAVQPELTPAPAGRGECILVVDDEASVRNIAQQTLETYGYRVKTAVDGPEAVAACAQQPGKIDLMLTDMAMPIMDGVAVIRAVRTLEPRIRVITASGLPPENRGFDTEQFRANAVLYKPYTAEQLLRVVRQVLDGPRPP